MPRLLPAAFIVLTLCLPSLGSAATKGRVIFSNLPAHGQGDGFEMASSEVDFGDAGECDVTLQAMLKTALPSLVHDMADVIDEVKLETLGGKGGNQVTYRATLYDVHVVRIDSRTLWGSMFEDITLAPAQVKLQVYEPKPDGTMGAPSQVMVTCVPHR